MARMLPREVELVAERTGLRGGGHSVKCFERSNGLDTALYKNIHFFYTFSPISVTRYSFTQLTELGHCGENKNGRASKRSNVDINKVSLD